ncbi:MAG: hypothetical protein ACK505_04345 [Flavobacteriales bacterium]
MKHFIVVTAWCLLAGAGVSAQKAGSEQDLAKEARSFFDQGDYLKAYPIYSQLVSLYPTNADYMYRFGACAIYSDSDKTKAVQYLGAATRKGSEDPMAWYYLGKAYHLNYQFREAVKAFETFTTKAGPKLAEKMNARREIEACIYGSTLLANIKDIQVMSKVEADRANFFRYMELEGVGGRVLTVPDELRTSYDKKQKETGVIHYPGNSNTIYFSSYGKDGSTGKDIYRASILPDGKFSTPELLKGDVNTRYDEDFCFMQSDGRTLYFSSRGHNSMGGYDIFKSVYDPSTDAFGPAINLDFAINTPDDDIFFIADSLNQRAYFASGRSSDQRHYHVYGVRVQGIPLQIIYIKGSFISEIDPSQKSARIQVKETAGGRPVMDATSERDNGDYLLYITKPGQYQFDVRTENSPIVHQALVDVPAFSNPVAVRQEMRLVNESGREKLIVTNYFETPLDEDLSALAADMLRDKARLEVNTTKEDILADAPLAIAIERDMSNSALAAGFAQGISAMQVTDGMNREADAIDRFVAESEQKYTNAFAFAQKKFFEAESALAQAEMMRETSGNLQTEKELSQAREMLKLLDKAESLQREARSAMAAAESVRKYKDSEAARSSAIRTSARAISTAEMAGDFDATVRELAKEKERQNKMRETPMTPHDELLAQARARDSELRSSEEKLSRLRDEEKRIVSEVKSAEQTALTAKKKSEKQEAEERANALKTELDAKRRQIVQEKIRTKELGTKAKDASTTAEFFKRLASDTQLGLSADQRVALDAAQREAIATKLNSMDARISSLQVTDPEMLAMITEGQDMPSSSAKSTTKPSSQPSMAPLPARTSQEIVARKEQALARLQPGDPSTPAVRNMILTNTAEEMSQRITAMEMKRRTGITPEEKQQLDALKASRSQIQKEMQGAAPAIAAATPEQARQTYLSVDPEFTNRVTAINASQMGEIERTEAMLSMKEQLLSDLRNERLLNASASIEETDNRRIQQRAERDRELASAILTLQGETNPIISYRAAYQQENKEIMESGLAPASRLDSQITLTDNYLSTLGKLEEEQQKMLTIETDQEKTVAIRTRIGEIRKETELATARLEGYRQDRALAVSAGGPDTSITSAGAANNASIQAETPGASPSDQGKQGDPVKGMTEAQLASKVAADAEEIRALFKTKAESESIFAYETGELSAVLEKHDPQHERIKNLDKVNEVQQEILLLEAEIENEQSPARQRKLDIKAEDLYFRKAMMEIGNAPVIQEIMELEYQEARKEAEDFRIARADVINSRTMIRDEVNKLMNQSKSEYEEAQALRKQADRVKDEIEKNDYYRRAFAKEQLAVQLLKQATSIDGQLEMLTDYDDKQLAELRYGDPVKVTTELTSGGAQGAAATPDSAGTSAGATAQNPAGEQRSASTPPASGNVSSPAGEQRSASTPPASGNASSPAGEQRSASTPPASGNASSPAGEQRSVTAEPSTSGSGINYADLGTQEVRTDSRQVRSENRESAPAQVASVTPENVPAPVRRTTAPAPALSPEARATAGAYTSAEATSYYYSFPVALTKDLFVLADRSPYNDSRPIPVDAPMPSGVYYKVQVGAFRSGIPQNLFGEFAPVSGESLGNGVTRYLAGFFLNFDNAEKAKQLIRGKGFNDAFVVAYRDGKRIPLYEAMGMTEQDYQAAVEKEYVYGDGGEAPSARRGSSGSENNPSSGNADSGVRPVSGQADGSGGLFYTVQIGVYSKPASAAQLGNLTPLNSELMSSGKIRYTTGRFNNLQDAVDRREAAKAAGIPDAFITAYYNGQRITLSEADRLVKELGPGIFVRP